MLAIIINLIINNLIFWDDDISKFNYHSYIDLY